MSDSGKNEQLTGLDAPILTARLELTPLLEADAAALLEYRSDPDVSRFQTFEPRSVEDARRFIEDASGKSRDADAWTQFGICLRGSGLLVGDIGFHVAASQPRSAEIGVTVAPAHQGEGMATEAVSGLLGRLFEGLGVHRVFASVDPRNAASMAMLGRIGMREEAHFRQSLWFKGEWVDDVVFAMLATEWEIA